MDKINHKIGYFLIIIIATFSLCLMSIILITTTLNRTVPYDSSTPAPSTRNNVDQYYFGYWQSCMLNNTLPNNDGERDRYCDAALDKAIEGKWGELDNLIWPVIYEDAQNRVWQR